MELSWHSDDYRSTLGETQAEFRRSWVWCHLLPTHRAHRPTRLMNPCKNRNRTGQTKTMYRMHQKVDIHVSMAMKYGDSSHVELVSRAEEWS